MLPDFTIIQKHFPENKDLVIFPISDIHLGAALSSRLSSEKMSERKAEVVLLRAEACPPSSPLREALMR